MSLNCVTFFSLHIATNEQPLMADTFFGSKKINKNLWCMGQIPPISPLLGKFTNVVITLL